MSRPGPNRPTVPGFSQPPAQRSGATRCQLAGHGVSPGQESIITSLEHILIPMLGTSSLRCQS
eukprot:5881702-Pyramimonas_sp.AAC.1